MEINYPTVPLQTMETNGFKWCNELAEGSSAFLPVCCPRREDHDPVTTLVLYPNLGSNITTDD